MSKKFPLVVEPHDDDYQGYEFLTLIKYNDQRFLNIIDNVNKKYIYGYVVDLCGPEEFDEERLIETAYDWYYTNGDRFPISVEFSRRGMCEDTSRLLRAYPIDYVTRVIGPLPHFNMAGPTKVRKRKRKDIPAGVEIVRKSVKVSI